MYECFKQFFVEIARRTAEGSSNTPETKKNLKKTKNKRKEKIKDEPRALEREESREHLMHTVGGP